MTRAEGYATDLTAACAGLLGPVVAVIPPPAHQYHRRARKPCCTTSARNGSAETADGNRIPAGQS
jgi:hypothetical protein